MIVTGVMITEIQMKLHMLWGPERAASVYFINTKVHTFTFEMTISYFLNFKTENILYFSCCFK
jgi:hypothetical protein